MKSKLDKYFKQKLEAPQQPPADAWEFIRGRLPEPKEKKRILPFWLKLSGITATLLLMVGLGYWLGSEQAAIPDGSEYVFQPETSSSSGTGESGEQITKEKTPGHLSPNDGVPATQTHSYLNFAEVNSGNQTYSFTQSSFINENRDLYAGHFRGKEQDETLNRHAYGLSWDGLNLSPDKLVSITGIRLNPNLNKEFVFASNAKSHPEKEKKKKKRTAFDRFHLSAFASPLAFNTFVGNSMLADEMSQYKTENSVTLAYGIKGAYSLSPTLKLRTGVSVVGLEQITNQVPIAVDITERYELSPVDEFNNVKYNGNIRINNHSPANSLMEMELSGRMGYGSIQQQASYIEIPVEAELSLFQTNSIGISATGGGSTWLLSKNKIYVHIDDYTQELGEASNLNKVSFSANAGLKFDLSLTDNVKLNVEPNFRYLINPVNNIEKYNPYTVGVNAGVTVSFR